MRPALAELSEVVTSKVSGLVGAAQGEALSSVQSIITDTLGPEVLQSFSELIPVIGAVAGLILSNGGSAGRSAEDWKRLCTNAPTWGAPSGGVMHPCDYTGFVSRNDARDRKYVKTIGPVPDVKGGFALEGACILAGYDALDDAGLNDRIGVLRLDLGQRTRNGRLRAYIMSQYERNWGGLEAWPAYLQALIDSAIRWDYSAALGIMVFNRMTASPKYLDPKWGKWEAERYLKDGGDYVAAWMNPKSCIAASDIHIDRVRKMLDAYTRYVGSPYLDERTQLLRNATGIVKRIDLDSRGVGRLSLNLT